MLESRPGTRIPLIAEHDTWISVDPIVGCPANCKYCYLGPLGLRARKPYVRAEPAALVSALEFYLSRMKHLEHHGRLSRIPICFGNYTDTFMSQAGISYFLDYARLHAAKLGSHPLCVVTKARLTEANLAALDKVGQRVTFFLSQSLLNQPGEARVEHGPTSTMADTLASIRLLAGSQNATAVHFLRPVTRRSVPGLESAVALLEQMRSAGARATVAVGLKLGPGVDLSGQEISAIAGEHHTATDAAPEYFPAEARLALLEAARITGFPVYFNTSCALALVNDRAEELGTWRAPMRWSRCEPVNCPARQRSQCDIRRLNSSIPTDAELARLRAFYGVPAGALKWNSAENFVRVDHTIGQYTFNRLVHAVPYRIVVRSVEPQEAWVGPFVREAELTAGEAGENAAQVPDAQAPGPHTDWRTQPPPYPREIAAGAERLRSITGFVTTLCKGSDRRAEVFSRYFHVRRVAWLASMLSQWNRDTGAALNTRRVHWLAWAHDLNRWPFAHNSERGVFDQAADLERFFTASGIGSCWADLGYPDEAALLTDVHGIVSKSAGDLSREAKIVLLADMVAGFVEDPLLAITGLDIRPTLIPPRLRAKLALSADDLKLTAMLHRLNAQLYGNDVTGFIKGFDKLFQDRARAFVRLHSLTGPDTLLRESFASLRSQIREGLLRRILFPYNNEKVAHGTVLRSSLMDPLRKILGSDSARVFTSITEDELLELAVENSIVPAGLKAEYFPDLDYVSRMEPENSFRLTTTAAGPKLAANG